MIVHLEQQVSQHSTRTTGMIVHLEQQVSQQAGPSTTTGISTQGDDSPSRTTGITTQH